MPSLILLATATARRYEQRWVNGYYYNPIYLWPVLLHVLQEVSRQITISIYWGAWQQAPQPSSLLACRSILKVNAFIALQMAKTEWNELRCQNDKLYHPPLAAGARCSCLA